MSCYSIRVYRNYPICSIFCEGENMAEIKTSSMSNHGIKSILSKIII